MPPRRESCAKTTDVRTFHTDAHPRRRDQIHAPQHHVSLSPRVDKYSHNENGPFLRGTFGHQKGWQPKAWAAGRSFGRFVRVAQAQQTTPHHSETQTSCVDHFTCGVLLNSGLPRACPQIAARETNQCTN